LAAGIAALTGKMKMSVSNRTFGIELEMQIPRGDYRGLIAAINATGNECQYMRLTHAVPNSWKITTDGSLTFANGYELVSPVLQGEAGLATAYAVSKACLDFGCKIKTECGFHLHVGVADFNLDEMAALMLNYVWFEDFFDHILPESRRRNSSQYINSNRQRFGGYGTAAVNAAFPIIKGALETARTATTSNYYSMRPCRGDIERSYGMEVLINAFVGTQRYVKLNLYSAYLAGDYRPGNKCAEFRQHSGTVDPEKVCNWIKLKCAFVDKSKVSRPRPRTVTRDLTPAEEMHRFFAYLGDFCEPSVKAYYMERRKALAKEVAVNVAADARLVANAEAEARELIAALEARIVHVQGFSVPPRLRISHMRNAIYSLTHSLSGAMPYGMTSRAEYVATIVRRTRASNLLPAVRAPRASRSASVALAA
jgi:hypothetical protein